MKRLGQIVFYTEMVFLLQVVQRCITEYQPADSIYPVRKCSKIILRYVKEEFVYDLLPLVPFVELFKFPGSRSLLLFKLFRLRSVVYVLNTKRVMRQIKAIYQVQLEKDCKDPVKRYNMDEDNNKIMEIVRFVLFFKICKLAFTVLILVFLVAMIGMLLV